MASRVGQSNRILAHPGLATRFPFRRDGSDCLDLGGYVAERQVGSSDVLDVRDVRIRRWGASQRNLSAPSPIDFKARLHAGDCNSRRTELTTAVFPGGMPTRGKAVTVKRAMANAPYGRVSD